jgi:hypothetical protein
MMRKYLAGISVFIAIVVLIATFIISITEPKAEATPIIWTSQKIEDTALIYAQHIAFKGTPTSIVSKKMSVADFRLLLDPFSKGDLGTDEVWLVLLKGKVVINHPSQNSITSQTMADTMWVNLTPDGRVIGWGTLAPGTKLDLNGPLPTQLTSWPTLSPVNSKG